jgi:hypothetical protein
MPKIDFKKAVVTAIAGSVAGGLLIYGLYSTLHLPLRGWSGLGAFLVLLVITIVTSRFTVPVTHVDGSSQIQTSVADTLIFLAVMMYTLSPAHNYGPPIILAASMATIASFDWKQRAPTI